MYMCGCTLSKPLQLLYFVVVFFLCMIVICYEYCCLLTLGAHALEGYGSLSCVCLCVCVSVRNLNLGTGASRVERHILPKIKIAFSLKPLR